MKNSEPQHIRVIGISLSARGVGFAIMDGENTLVDWGVRVVKGDKNARCLSHIGNLVSFYEPTVLVLENVASKGSRRVSRIQDLSRQVSARARSERIRVKLFEPKQIGAGLLDNPDVTKYAIAELLASRFPDELGLRLPKKRKAWMSADSRMDIFDAVALAEQYFRSIRPNSLVGDEMECSVQE